MYLHIFLTVPLPYHITQPNPNQPDQNPPKLRFPEWFRHLFSCTLAYIKTRHYICVMGFWFQSVQSTLSFFFINNRIPTQHLQIFGIACVIKVLKFKFNSYFTKSGWLFFQIEVKFFIIVTSLNFYHRIKPFLRLFLYPNNAEYQTTYKIA